MPAMTGGRTCSRPCYRRETEALEPFAAATQGLSTLSPSPQYVCASLGAGGPEAWQGPGGENTSPHEATAGPPVQTCHPAPGRLLPVLSIRTWNLISPLINCSASRTHCHFQSPGVTESPDC